MTITELGALGEFIGAIAVVVTLIFLSVQVRYSARAMDETNRLERASALDRHNDSVSRWRGRLMENEELARIWLAATNDEELAEIEVLRLNNLWIDLLNTQRSNFARARAVGDNGLAHQAVLAVVNESYGSRTLLDAWKAARPRDSFQITSSILHCGFRCDSVGPRAL
jgi:hypothetical protein